MEFFKPRIYSLTDNKDYDVSINALDTEINNLKTCASTHFINGITTVKLESIEIDNSNKTFHLKTMEKDNHFVELDNITLKTILADTSDINNPIFYEIEIPNIKLVDILNANVTRKGDILSLYAPIIQIPHGTQPKCNELNSSKMQI